MTEPIDGSDEAATGEGRERFRAAADKERASPDAATPGKGREGPAGEGLAAKIRARIEADGAAFIPAEDVWAAFTTGGHDAGAVGDALAAFAEANGWVVSTNEPAFNPAYIFYEREERQ